MLIFISYTLSGFAQSLFGCALAIQWHNIAFKSVDGNELDEVGFI